QKKSFAELLAVFSKPAADAAAPEAPAAEAAPEAEEAPAEEETPAE
nr:30S ribosomal protein S2 [Oscillospiraceae bacterium]